MLVQAPYQLSDGSRTEASVDFRSQSRQHVGEISNKRKNLGVVRQIGIPAGTESVFRQYSAESRRTSGHVEVVNERIRDCAKKPCADFVVCRMVEICTECVYVVEFENRDVREIEAG